MAFIQKHGFKIAVLCLCALFALYLGYKYVSGQPSNVQLIEGPAPAPDYELRNLDDELVTLQDSNGKARLYYFYFANCPDVCPPTTQMMTQVQDLLQADGTYGKDVEFFSISYDATRDDVAKINIYIDQFKGAIDQSGWTFLRAQEGMTDEDMMKLGGDFGLQVVKDPATGNFNHVDTIVAVDKDGYIRKYIEGRVVKDQTPEKIREIVNAMLREK
jgi:protein SCO1/2